MQNPRKGQELLQSICLHLGQRMATATGTVLPCGTGIMYLMSPHRDLQATPGLL